MGLGCRCITGYDKAGRELTKIFRKEENCKVSFINLFSKFISFTTYN